MSDGRGRSGSDTLIHFHAEISFAVGRGGPGQRAVKAHHRHREATPGDLDAVGDLRDDTYLRVFAIAAARHQEHTRVGTGIHRQGHLHAREDHRVVQGNQSV